MNMNIMSADEINMFVPIYINESIDEPTIKLIASVHYTINLYYSGLITINNKQTDPFILTSLKMSSKSQGTFVVNIGVGLGVRDLFA